MADEANIFEAVKEWTRKNAGVEVDTIVNLVRLPLMTIEQLLTVVRPSKLIHSDIILNAIEEKSHIDGTQHSKAIGTFNRFL